jgi:hypothetical protein
MSSRTLLSRYGGQLVMIRQPIMGNYDIHNHKDSFLELFQLEQAKQSLFKL